MLHYITMCQYYSGPNHLNTVSKTDTKTKEKEKKQEKKNKK